MENNNFVKYKDLLTIKKYNEVTDEEEFTLLPLENDFVIGRYQESINMLEYGDKEWAYYYKKEMALYNQVNIDRVFKDK